VAAPSASASALSGEQIAAYNERYDAIVNQHRKIKSPPEDPLEAFQDYLTARPKFPRACLTLMALAFFAFLFVPGSAYGAAILCCGLGALVVAAIWFGAASAKIGAWRKEDRARRELIDSALGGHFTAIESILTDLLCRVDWVLDTSASFELSPDGSSISIDANLPEIEDLDGAVLVARKGAAAPQTVPKERWVVQREYQLLIHAIVLRMAGEVFYHFPTIQKVLVSGYSDRPDRATGLIRGEYVISVVFSRELWARISPANADPVDCVALFRNRRDIGADSYMSAIEPFAEC
jgi:hypothetical protein